MNSKEETILLLKNKKCDICGKLKSDVRRLVNPYMLELRDITLEQMICTKCYGDLKDDI